MIRYAALTAVAVVAFAPSLAAQADTVPAEQITRFDSSHGPPGGYAEAVGPDGALLRFAWICIAEEPEATTLWVAVGVPPSVNGTHPVRAFWRVARAGPGKADPMWQDPEFFKSGPMEPEPSWGIRFDAWDAVEFTTDAEFAQTMEVWFLGSTSTERVGPYLFNVRGLAPLLDTMPCTAHAPVP